MQRLNSGGAACATYAYIKSISGDIGSEKLLETLSLRPTIAKVEEAPIWLSGDSDVFSAVEPVKGNTSHIITILTTEKKEEPRAG